MACCCKNTKTKRASTICLGRCDLPKHKCLPRYIVKPGTIPRHYGWLYNARDAPDHQLRCGWRPGHISCSVLRRMEQYYNRNSSECKPCPSVCSKCSKICPHVFKLPTNPSTMPLQQKENQPLIRITRHGGQYSICTKPSNITNAPSGPYPLKYVLNTQPDTSNQPKVKTRFSVEAKYNNYQFDYTTSNTSFILDFTPPELMDGNLRKVAQNNN
ncbi:uncharacterized protein LOC121734610 [Aricia agestis]|uniref:uncharacterized protein LOC121734610 n=1 Tax=Aricia agestis TaxID=91739 RepID=UPI001C209642|nr:uncharacterized protein LOC121734610 [Aricia agestis]XP_041981130.1 uncharacterized protein LOC121734610 [Aricia agestis]